MVLEKIREAFLERRLKKQIGLARGTRRVALQKQLSQIKFQQAFRQQVIKEERQAFQTEQMAQAKRIGQERAKITAKRRIQTIKAGGGQGGVLSGFDKFLAGTGVAKGTAPVLRKGGGMFGGGDSSGFSVIGGPARKGSKRRRII